VSAARVTDLDGSGRGDAVTWRWTLSWKAAITQLLYRQPRLIAAAYGPVVRRDVPEAVLGAGVWSTTTAAAAAGLWSLSLIDVLLLLAPLVLVPLGMVVAGRRGPARWARSAAAIALVPALLVERGGWAAALAVPWLGCSVAFAVVVLRAWSRDRDLHPAALARVASAAYLVVGATWLVGSRLGVEPFGIAEPIVQLTAVHFHFAGFVAALLAARTCEAAEGSRWAAVATLCTIGAPPVVAAGFTTGSAVFQIGGATLLAGGLWLLAAVTLAVVAPATAPGAARVLLRISALAVVAPMVLAVSWAAGQHLDVPAFDIPTMARIHGTINAFGFSLAGLLGWAARDAAPVASPL